MLQELKDASDDIVGYVKLWYYGGSDDFDRSGFVLPISDEYVIQPSENRKGNDTFDLIEMILKYKSFKLGKLDNRPLGFPGETTAYLLKSAIVLVHKTKEPPKHLSVVNIPSHFVTIMAAEEEQVNNVAKYLNLPLEKIVLNR